MENRGRGRGRERVCVDKKEAGDERKTEKVAVLPGNPFSGKLKT